MRPAISALVAASFLLVGTPHAVAAQSSGDGASTPLPLAWLAGCWEQRTPRRIVQELWLPPASGTLQGMGRTLRRTAAGDSVTEFEFLRIVARAGGTWVYLAQPGGRPPTEFTANGVSDTLVTFTNLQHDFPQRVSYARRGADSLLARVEGPVNGTTRAIVFAYARSACW